MALLANRDFKRIKLFLASNRFFGVILVFFVLEAAWIALSGRYPMAFDENFHLGIFKLYAHHLSPFWAAQPAGADAYGAVARDPSYLYHWLMSFPYRLSSNIIFLRFINIGLFAAGLWLYRRLLLKTGASRAIIHLCLAIFVLIPVVPLLAAQINYDNLLLPLTALSLLLTVNFSEQLRQQFDLRRLMLLTVVVALTCLVKYAFLPIALMIALYLLIRLWQTYRGTKELWSSVSTGWAQMRPLNRWLLVVAVILSLGLFTQRYGVNMVRYHTPIPDCSAVLSVRQCSAYSPWLRDHYLQTHKDPAASTSALTFSADWFYGMWMRSFFAVDGPGTNFTTRGPLVLPGIGAVVFSVAALVTAIAAGRRLFKRYNRHVLWLFIGVILAYVGALWLDGYQSFLQTGQATAINGRYLFPVIPLLLVILAMGINVALGRCQGLKLAVGALVLICMLWGGGALTYIVRSNSTWYWPNSSLTGVNQTIRQDVGPLLPGYYSPNEFMGRN